MSDFLDGFTEELEKLAISPQTKAWAVSRALTSGVSGGLMAGMAIRMAQSNRPKSEQTPLLAASAPAAVVSTAIGLGKGIFEKGIEQKVLKAITKIR